MASFNSAGAQLSSSTARSSNDASVLGGGGGAAKSTSATTKYDKKTEVTISKFLSLILRHKASDFRLTMGKDGFVKLKDILALERCRSLNVETADIFGIVDGNEKKRFEIADRSGELYIRAVQGHSIASVDDELLLTKILSAEEIPVCIHGTYHKFVDLIVSSGLKRMSRNHIHMAVGVGAEVVSGIRSNVEVLVYVDAKEAMGLGIEFFRSNNNVILTAGLTAGGSGESGSIPPACILRIVDHKTGAVLWPKP